MSSAESFDQVFRALADPYRRGFVTRLATGPASVMELAAPIGLKLPAVLKHLRVLEESGIVASEKIGRVRTYRMQPNALRAAGDWLEQRQFEMNIAFDRLAMLMAEIPEEKDH